MLLLSIIMIKTGYCVSYQIHIDIGRELFHIRWEIIRTFLTRGLWTWTTCCWWAGSFLKYHIKMSRIPLWLRIYEDNNQTAGGTLLFIPNENDQLGGVNSLESSCYSEVGWQPVGNCLSRNICAVSITNCIHILLL